MVQIQTKYWNLEDENAAYELNRNFKFKIKYKI